MSRCIVMVQHPDLVYPLFRPHSSHCVYDVPVNLFWQLEQTRDDFCPSSQKKKRPVNITFTFDQLWHAFFGHGNDSHVQCNDSSSFSLLYPFTQHLLWHVSESFLHDLSNLSTPECDIFDYLAHQSRDVAQILWHYVCSFSV